MIPPFDSHIGWILLKGFSIWLLWPFTGIWKGTSSNKFYEQLGWESLSDRRWFHRLVQLFKIHGSLPLTLKPQFRVHEIIFLLPEMKMTFTALNAEQTLTCIVFYPHSVKIWNEIGPTLRQVPSLNIFKSNVLKLIRPQKKNVFNIHDPEGTKRLFQLRVGLSPLRYHKKRHNFKDSPSDTCICGMSVETTEHFLIYCKSQLVSSN